MARRRLPLTRQNDLFKSIAEEHVYGGLSRRDALIRAGYSSRTARLPLDSIKRIMPRLYIAILTARQEKNAKAASVPFNKEHAKMAVLHGLNAEMDTADTPKDRISAMKALGEAVGLYAPDIGVQINIREIPEVFREEIILAHRERPALISTEDTGVPDMP